MQSFARLAIGIAKEQKMYLVLDADALLLVGQDKDLVSGYVRAVLTPNVVEFKRLSESLVRPLCFFSPGRIIEFLQQKIDPSTPAHDLASSVSASLGGVTIVQKGPSDIIATNSSSNSQFTTSGSKEPPTDDVITVSVPGGLKRCGGQGDVLSGAVGTFLAWGKCYEDEVFGPGSGKCEKEEGKDRLPLTRIPLLASAAGSYVTRTTSRRTFEQMKRSMVTQDMLSEIGAAFEECFEGGHGAPKL